MTAQEWVAAFADKLGGDAPDQTTFDAVLELAAEAAHSSERTAAPVACYLAGVKGIGLDDAIALARQVAAD